MDSVIYCQTHEAVREESVLTFQSPCVGGCWRLLCNALFIITPPGVSVMASLLLNQVTPRILVLSRIFIAFTSAWFFLCCLFRLLQLSYVFWFFLLHDDGGQTKTTNPQWIRWLSPGSWERTARGESVARVEGGIGWEGGNFEDKNEKGEPCPLSLDSCEEVVLCAAQTKIVLWCCVAESNQCKKVFFSESL